MWYTIRAFGGSTMTAYMNPLSYANRRGDFCYFGTIWDYICVTLAITDSFF